MFNFGAHGFKVPHVALCCSLGEARLNRQYIVTVYQFHNKICFVLRSWTKLQKLISDKFCSISTLQNVPQQ